ncbi:mercury resistance system transport protein MerF [Candidatus Nitrospira salsa]
MMDKNLSKSKAANRWITTGIVGAITSFICCITPLAVILLGLAGLGAWTGYLDYVVLPSLAFSIGLIGYGVYSQQCIAKKRGKSE